MTFHHHVVAAIALGLTLLSLYANGMAISSSKSNNKKLLTNDGKGGGGGFGTRNNVVPTTHTRDTLPTTKALVDFLSSQQSRGLNNDDGGGVEIGYNTATGLRGVYATRPFKKGQVLCQIPSDCALALSDPQLGGDDVPTIAHAGRNLILMYLQDEEAQQLWRPYLDTLPTRNNKDDGDDEDDDAHNQFDPTPDFFSNDEIQKLEFPRAVEYAKQRKRDIETVAKKEGMSVDELQFATWLVSSRSFSLQITAGDPTNPPANNDASSGSIVKPPSKSIRVLLPFLDMINHSSNNANAELHLIDPEKDEAWFAIRATRPIPQGKEVTICYGTGVDSSVELQGNYGFVPTDNKIDALMLKRGGEGCIEDESGWSTTLEEDLDAFETAKGNMRSVLALRIRLKRAYADIGK